MQTATKGEQMPKDSSDQPPEEGLWKSAIKLRTNMDAASYKHPVLGLIFLKYISDAFDAHRDQLKARYRRPASEDHVDDPDVVAELLEDRDEYRADNVFWVPADARWAIVEQASAATVAKIDRRRPGLDRGGEHVPARRAPAHLPRTAAAAGSVTRAGRCDRQSRIRRRGGRARSARADLRVLRQELRP